MTGSRNRKKTRAAKYRGKERVSELMEASQCGLTKVPVSKAGEA